MSYLYLAYRSSPNDYYAIIDPTDMIILYYVIHSHDEYITLKKLSL